MEHFELHNVLDEKKIKTRISNHIKTYTYTRLVIFCILISFCYTVFFFTLKIKKPCNKKNLSGIKHFLEWLNGIVLFIVVN